MGDERVKLHHALGNHVDGGGKILAFRRTRVIQREFLVIELIETAACLRWLLRCRTAAESPPGRTMEIASLITGNFPVDSMITSAPSPLVASRTPRRASAPLENVMSRAQLFGQLALESAAGDADHGIRAAGLGELHVQAGPRRRDPARRPIGPAKISMNRCACKQVVRI